MWAVFPAFFLISHFISGPTASAATVAYKPPCIIKSRQDALDKVRGTYELFQKLNRTDGIMDYLSSFTGCPRQIRSVLYKRFTDYYARVAAAEFPLDAE